MAGSRSRKAPPRAELTDGQKELARQIAREFQASSVDDIQDAFRKMLGFTIETILEAEMAEHLGYDKSERTDRTAQKDYRNGVKKKTLKTNLGPTTIAVPQDRLGTFEPKIVKKWQTDISGMEEKILSMYGAGMSTRQIAEIIASLYGSEVSESFISDVTDRILPRIYDWQSRPLDPVYPVLFIDAIHFNLRVEGEVKKVAANVVMCITSEGKKDVLAIDIQQAESAKNWLAILNGLKARGVQDVLIVCADGLSGLTKSVSTAFPDAIRQRCVIHMKRESLENVNSTDRIEFSNDIKSIYMASTESVALQRLDEVSEKWSKKYPRAMKPWYAHWDEIKTIFKFSPDFKRVIYTTNAIESLNSAFRRHHKQRGAYPSEQSLMKVLYLTVENMTKKWIAKIHHWPEIYNELCIMFEDRMP